MRMGYDGGKYGKSRAGDDGVVVCMRRGEENCRYDQKRRFSMLRFENY